MPILIKVALFGWPPLVLLLFWLLPRHRALLVAVIAGTLLLPEVQFAKVSEEAPDASDVMVLGLAFTKPIAIGFSVLLGAVLFDGRRLLSFRPRWFDVPMLAWCLCPLVSDLGNGASLLTALVAARDQFLTWGIPYFLARVYLNDAQTFRDLTLGIVLGGLAYAPVCLFESRYFPELHEGVYGFFPGSRNEVFHTGGYRPVGFLSHSLMVGLWMTATTVVALCLWWSGTMRRVPAVLSALCLLLTALWVRSMGALFCGLLSILAVLQLRLLRVPILLVLLVLYSPVYITARISGWTGESMTRSMTDTGMDADRVSSLAFRLHRENRLIQHYRQKPAFGWGDFNREWRRAPKLKPDDEMEAITDAMWAMDLARYGLFGLAALWLAMLLPVVRFLIVQPSRLWFHPALGPPVSAALVLVMYMIDNLFNSFFNGVFVLAAGALAGVTATWLPETEAKQATVSRSESS